MTSVAETTLTPTGALPVATRVLDEAPDAFAVASQRQLIWRRFRKHKLALAGLGFLLLLYLAALFADFIGPYGPVERFPQNLDMPPAHVHMRDASGHLHLPFVYGTKNQVDLATLQRSYTEDTTKRYPLTFLPAGQQLSPARIDPDGPPLLRRRAAGRLVHVRHR